MILAIIMIAAFVAAAAFCIDVAYMQLVQTQLRSATDAASRAGAEALSRGLTVEQARDIAKAVARANTVAGEPLVLGDDDIVFGTAAIDPADPGGRLVFTPSNTDVNAIRVNGRRTADSPGGSVATLLASRFYETPGLQGSKVATAAVEDRDIVIVVDRSGSMNDEDAGQLPVALAARYGPYADANADGLPDSRNLQFDDDADGNLRRIEALKIAVLEMMRTLDESASVERVALVSFSEFANVESTLAAAESTLEDRVVYLQGSGYTAVGDGILKGLEVLQDPQARRPHAVPVLFVLTDGESNRGENPASAADKVMQAYPELSVHTITFSSEANLNAMSEVARIGKGLHLHADDSLGLIEQFEILARSAGVVLVE